MSERTYIVIVPRDDEGSTDTAYYSDFVRHRTPLAARMHGTLRLNQGRDFFIGELVANRLASLQSWGGPCTTRECSKVATGLGLTS